MMRRFFIGLVLCLSFGCTFAQESRLIDQLKDRRGVLQKQIRETESLLKNTQKTVASQLNHLASLTGQIAERKRYIQTINSDVNKLQRELNMLERQVGELNRDLEDKKEKYAQSMRYLYRNKSFEEKLMFVLSAENFSQSIRRLRYVQQYASFQEQQGKDIVQKREQIVQKKAELEKVRQEKKNLLKERETEKKKLEGEENKKRGVVASLQKKQKSLQSTIKQKRTEANKLNAKIDQLINEEIERSRKAAKAKPVSKQLKTEKIPETKKPLETYNLDKEDVKLSANFADNYGKLPMPISGSYIIVSHYGQYAVNGLKNVTLDNKGIDIQGKPGAKARAVFNGKVVAVFKLNGLFNILVRHGNYISVYCNLSSTNVENGEKVSTKQALGNVFSDSSDNNRTVLHFQLRKEKTKLNPEQWLNK